MNTMADALNAAINNAPKHVIEALAANKPMPVQKSDPKAAQSATGKVVEGAMAPISKKPESVSHYVTAQGFRAFFESDSKVSARLLNLLTASLKDDWSYVCDMLDKSISDMPHAKEADPKRGIVAATHAELMSYQVASNRRTDFRRCLGAIKFIPANGIFEMKDGILSCLMTERKASLAAKAALEAAGIDWKGQSLADKQERAATRTQRAAAKAVSKRIEEMISKGIKFDSARVKAMQEAELKDAEKEVLQKKLESMQDRAASEVKGLLKYFNDDRKLAIKYASMVLKLLKDNVPV